MMQMVFFFFRLGLRCVLGLTGLERGLAVRMGLTGLERGLVAQGPKERAGVLMCVLMYPKLSYQQAQLVESYQCHLPLSSV